MAKKKAKVERFVLDGSVSLAWFFKDEANPYADAVAARFPESQAVAPAVWPLEVGNGVLMGERRKHSTEAQATKWLGYLAGLPILVDDLAIPRAWGDVLRLGRTHALSAYDAAYLELALRLGLPLASLDDKLKAAAKTVGVVAYRP
jgi:predicted nucleic acid-binding protein